MGGITAASDKTVGALMGVRDKISTVDAISKDTGRTMGTLKMRIDALQAERDWIPADNIPAIKEYNKQINQLTREINDLEVASSGGKFKNWAKDAFSSIPGSQFITNPLVAMTAGLGFSGKSAMNFDENMAKVNLTAGLDESGLADLKKRVRQITNDNRADITFAPVGLEKIISQTGDLELSLDILTQVQRGAKAGFVDMDTVAGALAQTLSVVGKENTNAQEVLDTFFAAKRVGAGEFSDFARYMPSLIAGANNMGIAYKEVAGTFAYMTGKGQTAEKAAVLMENAFSVLGRGEVRDKLSSLTGVDVFDDSGKIRGLVDIFGELQGAMSALNDEQRSSLLEQIGITDKEAKNAFSVLTADIDKLNSSMNAVKNSAGESDAALALSHNTVQQATEVWNKFKDIGLTVGEMILPIISVGLSATYSVLSGVYNVLNFVVGLFSGWYSLLQEGNPIIWALTAALGAYTIAVGANYAISQKAVIISGVKKTVDIASTAVTWGLTAAQTALNAAFYASPLGWIALAIGAVVGVVALCWQKFEGFRAAIFGVWSVIKEFGKSLINSIVDPFKQVLKGIGGVCSAIVNLVKGNFKEAAAQAKAGFKDIGTGVITGSPIGVAVNTVKGGDYKQAWQDGTQAGRDSWARSQESKEESSIPEAPQTPEFTPTALPKVPTAITTTSSSSKVLDLNDNADRDFKESAAYSSVVGKLTPKVISLMPTSSAQERVEGVTQGGKASANILNDREQTYEPKQENYLSEILLEVRRIAAAVAIPIALTLSAPEASAAEVMKLPTPMVSVPEFPALSTPMVELPEPKVDIPVPSDAFTLPSELGAEQNNSYVSETKTINNSGKTYRIDKVCDSIVIHVENTDNKGRDTIKEEIIKLLEELSDE